MNKWFVIFTMVLMSSLSYGQYDVEDVEKDSTTASNKKVNPFELKEKIYVGSGLNVLFGNQTFFYISPLVGYDITPKFSVGISTMYQYYRQSFNGNTLFTQNSVGIGVFTRFRPIEPLLLESSFNTYSTKFNGNSDNKLKAKSWMLGVGYANSLGGRSYYQIMIQYDLLRDPGVPEPAIINFANGGRLYYKFGLIFYLSNN